MFSNILLQNFCLKLAIITNAIVKLGPITRIAGVGELPSVSVYVFCLLIETKPADGYVTAESVKMRETDLARLLISQGNCIDYSTGTKTPFFNSVL